MNFIMMNPNPAKPGLTIDYWIFVSRLAGFALSFLIKTMEFLEYSI